MSSKIREKFVEHMELFGLTKQTQRGYISGVRCLQREFRGQFTCSLREDCQVEGFNFFTRQRLAIPTVQVNFSIKQSAVTLFHADPFLEIV